VTTQLIVAGSNEVEPPSVEERGHLRSRWLTFFGRRLVRLIISLWILVTATFAMVHLIPGDPVVAALGDQATGTLIRQRRHELGLDLPILLQYWNYVSGLFHGNFGESFITQGAVSDLLATRFPNTLRLALPAFAIVILVAVPLGMFAAVRTRNGRGRVTRGIFVTLTGFFNSIPDFVIATFLTVVFVIALRLLPAAGNATPASYVLPTAALVLGPIASLSRIVRVEALRVLDTEYVRAARSRRLPAATLYLRHVLPNMLTASLTFGGLILTGLVAGTVLVENVFGWPGVGTLISQAVVQKDYPEVQGVLLVLGAAVLILNMVIDVVLGLLDPRSRIAGV
jgi:peptide/nickel transport system permease protein